MTRRDYVKLAAALNKAGQEMAGDIIRLDGVRLSAERLADTLAQDNPHFDRARFMKAAGFEE